MLTTDEQIALYPREAAAVAEMGLHPHEAIPRAQTFIHERILWEQEVERLREQVTSLEKQVRDEKRGAAYWRSIAPKD